MFKILFARPALFQAISEYFKVIEQPNGKEGLGGNSMRNCRLLILKKGRWTTELPVRTSGRTLAEAREIINKKATVVLEEVQG
jgi:hypothetical protein